MGCDRCDGSRIYLFDELICPKCDHLALVPYDDSLKIIKHIVKDVTDTLLNEVKDFQRNELLVGVLQERENHIRTFYSSYTGINLGKLAACNLLLKRTIQMSDFRGNKKIDKNIIQEIVETYTRITEHEEYLCGLEAKNYVMLKLKSYDINNLHNFSLKNDVLLCQTEEYGVILKFLEKYNVMPEEKANKKIDAWRPLLKPAVLGSKKSKDSQETITRFYETISNLYTGFFKNKVYFEAFGLSRIEKVAIDPFKLKKLATLHPLDSNITVVGFDEFKKEVSDLFGNDADRVMKHFVLSNENSTANPLFLKLNNSILISQAFAELFSYVLCAILNRKIFDHETEKRSKIFESSIVRKEFEKDGYKYIPNYVVKGKMEIDGIAISDSSVFVIEVKGWKMKGFIEERESRERLERDIKNAIDGIHSTHSTGKTKRRVSLPNKVEWVKNNQDIFGISKGAQIIGMLVINQEPTIKEYKGCIVRYLDDFDFN